MGLTFVQTPTRFETLKKLSRLSLFVNCNYNVGIDDIIYIKPTIVSQNEICCLKVVVKEIKRHIYDTDPPLMKQMIICDVIERERLI